MIAGKATPIDARMMWKPSVKAIWLRAASSVEAARGSELMAWSWHFCGRLRGRGVVLPPVDAGRLGAVEHLRAMARGEVVPSPRDEGIDAVARARHEQRVHAEPGRERDHAVQLVAVRAHLGDGGPAA